MRKQTFIVSKPMHRVLAIALAFCMLFGFMPAQSYAVASDGAEQQNTITDSFVIDFMKYKDSTNRAGVDMDQPAAPRDYFYNIKYLDLRMATGVDQVENNNKGVDPKTITSFEQTSGDTQIHPNTPYKTDPWHYVGLENALFAYTSTAYGGLIRASAQDGWAAVKIRVSQTGRYNLSSMHFRAPAGATVRVYLAPDDAENPRSDEYILNVIDTSGSNQNESVLPIATKRLTAGDYIVTYQILSVSESRTDYYVTGLKLEGIEDISDEATLTVSAQSAATVEKGSTVSLPLTAARSDGAAIDYTAATVDVQYSTADIASAAALKTEAGISLQVEGLAAGKTSLTATVTADGLTASATVDVTVTAPALASYNYSFLYLDLRFATGSDRVELNNKGVDPKTITSFDQTSGDTQIHPDTIRKTDPWHFVELQNALFVFASSTYGGLIRANTTDAWAAVKIRVPKDGVFAASSVHFRTPAGAAVRFYLAPDGADDPLASEYILGTADTSGAALAGHTLPINTTRLTAGDYILTYQIISMNETPARTDYYVTGFKLDEVEDIPVIDQFYADSAPVQLAGSEAALALHAVRTDGSTDSLADYTVNAASDHPEVAEVVLSDNASQTGKILTVSYLSPGTATITVTAQKGEESFQCQIPVTVSDGSAPVKSLALKLRKTQISVGGMTAASVAATLEDGLVLDFDRAQLSSSNPAVASVGEDGMVRGVAAGSSQIAAVYSGDNGEIRSEPVTVTVVDPELKYDFLKLDLYRAHAQVDPNQWNKGYDVTKVTRFEQTTEGHPDEINPESQVMTQPWYFDGAVNGSFGFYSSTYAMIFLPSEWGNRLSVKLRVPSSGKYQAVSIQSATVDAGIVRYYLAPDGAEDPCADAYCIGVVDTYSAANQWNLRQALKAVDVTAGDYTLSYRVVGQNPASGGRRLYVSAFQLEPLAEEPSMALRASPPASVNPGFTTDFLVTGAASNGYIDDLRDAVITVESADPSIAQISVSSASQPESTIGRTLTMTSVSPGSTTLTIRAQLDGQDLPPLTIPVTVKTPVLNAFAVAIKPADLNLNRDPVPLQLTAKDPDGDPICITPDMLRFTISDPSVVSVSPEGVVTPLALGAAEITVELTVGSVSKTGTVSVTVKASKTASTYYTEEKVQNARANVQSLSWARELRDSAVQAADEYVDQADALWSLIPGEGLPRSATVGFQNDPDAYTCRYCGVDLRQKYGSYGWIVDPLTSPWKVQCPDCRRKFPSNDFASFYQLGLNEHGVFSREQALSRNAELVASGHNGYLKNIEHPDADAKFGLADWGVEDGFGYRPGRAYENSVTECHTYIAYYIHYGLWQTDSRGKGGAVLNGLISLRDAYLYTGEAKYGVSGSILLDRVADLYPAFDLSPYFGTYFNSHGGSGEGKIVGRIWEPDLASELALCYDAFYPAMENPQVIRFLADKASQYQLSNEKTSASLIRRNCEDGILREIYQGVKSAQIYGNFGFHQRTLALAATILDSMPETGDMIDFIMQAGTYSKGKCTGGDVAPTLIDRVCRDGFGDESGPGYNRIWVENIVEIADAMAGYSGYSAANLYEHPKFAAMLTAFAHLTLIRQGAPAIGDSGGTGTLGQQLKLDYILKAYQHTHNPDYAKLAWYLNGDTADGLRGDVFQENPDALAEEIRADVERYGEWDFDKSETLAGYGFSVLRRGGLYQSVGAQGPLDVQRDFWIYSGRTSGHGHLDALNLGIEAFGVNIAPDLGYPEATGANPNRYQWVTTTLSHNTVVVNESEQTASTTVGSPLHFDSSERVQVMDVEHRTAYSNLSDYRRTVVMVDVDGASSYGVDFFKVQGGNDHLYSFHALSRDVTEYTGFEPVKQADASGDYVGSYAGPDVPWGEDPGTVSGSLRYPKGYTWLKNVRRADSPSTGEFAVDFAIYEHKAAFPRPMDLHLRMTMLNGFDLDEITLAEGVPPRVVGNPDTVTYVLARRKGKNLNSLFTTVYEPYCGQRYLKELSQAPLTTADGEPVESGAKAVKVVHENGRTDYILYAEDNTVTYRLTDGETILLFRGFLGVCTIRDGEMVYRYLNDGDILGEETPSGSPALTGTVVDFSQELVSDNLLRVRLSGQTSAEELSGRYIYIENDGVQNAVYPIESAEQEEDNVWLLHLGNHTMIRALADKTDYQAGYVYNIAAGQSLRIPLSQEDSSAPVFAPVSSYQIAAGKPFSLFVHAESPAGREITYTAAELPRGANFTAGTGAISWTPSSSQIGEHVLAINASDGALVSTQYIRIKVYQSSGTGVQPGGEPGDTPGSDPGNDPGSVPGTDPGEDPPVNKRFVDLGGYSWAEESIYALVERGVVKGTSETTYSPANPVTRADFAILLVRAFGLTGSGGESFADVPASAYYAKEVAIAKENGIIDGIGNNRFAPEAPIKREDMMLILARVLKRMDEPLPEADEAALAQYADAASVSAYARQAVAQLVRAKLVTGSNGSLNPQGKTTRAETAVLLERILSK